MMKNVYILWSAEKQLIGVFYTGNDAKDFAEYHKMITGFYIEQTKLNDPTVLLKDGTY